MKRAEAGRSAAVASKFDALMFGTSGRALEALRDLVRNIGCPGPYREDVIYQLRKDIDEPLFIQFR
jgi:hypothetical protein